MSQLGQRCLCVLLRPAPPVPAQTLVVEAENVPVQGQCTRQVLHRDPECIPHPALLFQSHLPIAGRGQEQAELLLHSSGAAA